MCVLACAGIAVGYPEAAGRCVFVWCSLNGRFLNGYSYVIILFWKKQSLKIVKMLNKRTNVRCTIVLNLPR